jgi:hypothetical protein
MGEAVGQTTAADAQGDDEASFGEQVLNVSEAEVETKVQPHGVSDDLGRKAVAVIGRPVSGLGDGHQTRLIADPALKLTTPPCSKRTPTRSTSRTPARTRSRRRS